MGLTICVLASGSTGNCIYAATGATAVLIDAGLSGRETVRRLGEAGAGIGDIRAVCLTHEHADHCSGLRVLHTRFAIPLYANGATIEAVEQDGNLRGLAWNVFSTGSGFEIGDLRIEPFSVPHDSYDPVGFVLSSGAERAGIVTDIGVATGAVRERLRPCQALVIEANHDDDLLKAADRPWALKQRIRGRQGHLSNAQAGELLREVAGAGLRAVFLAHLSSQCNRPALAERAARASLAAAGYPDVAVLLTHQDRISAIVRLP